MLILILILATFVIGAIVIEWVGAVRAANYVPPFERPTPNYLTPGTMEYRVANRQRP